MTTPGTETSQFCVFRLDGDPYAVPVLDVREVLRVGELVPVPGSPPAVCGLVNLRGRVVGCLDPRILLRRPHAEAVGSIVVVVGVGDDHFGLMASSIDGVIDGGANGVDRLCALTAPHPAVESILRLENDLIPVLDLHKLLADLVDPTRSEESCPISAS